MILRIRRAWRALWLQLQKLDEIYGLGRAIDTQLHALARTIDVERQALHQRLDGQASRMEALFSELAELKRENRLLLGALSLPPPALWRDRPQVEPAKATNVFPASVGCRQEMFDTPYFAYWVQQIGSAPRYHRKLWEFVFICQVLDERGLLKPGSRGLGFGVGEEPLSALFAALGCQVVGTDMAPEAAAAAGWTQTQQYAAGKAALRRPTICPDEVFDAGVQFRVADMNNIPDDLTDFDFCWSACALEHLGSIEKGLTFIERSVSCLKPGGYAVHTTEFNLSSNDQTLDHEGTVLFRRQDMEALTRRLVDAGHIVAPLDFAEGLAPLDGYIDVAPYRDAPHLRLALAGYATTSFGLIVQRGPES